MAKNVIKIKCTSVLERTQCPMGIKEGDDWVYTSVTGEERYDWSITPQFCDRAFHDIYKQIIPVQFDVSFPWRDKRATELGCCTASCTIGAAPVLFELKKVESRER